MEGIIYGNHKTSLEYIERSVHPRVLSYSRTSMERFGPDGSACLEWTGRLCDGGYARMALEGSDGRQFWVQVHRLLAILRFGHEVVVGMDVDHLCRFRACINETHHEVVTRHENIMRGINPAVSGERLRQLNIERAGKPLSPETREKMRNARLGRTHSTETRLKMSESMKRRCNGS